MESIRIIGARENNLRDVTLDIPRGRMTVFTGRSGSGKSSLVFGTVAVEARRQLNETYSWFVRNRLPKYARPAVDTIEGLTPAVVVDQRPIGGNARSTVGTASGVHAILRVLFSRAGVPSAGEATAYSFNDPAGMCPVCDGLGRVVRPDAGKLLDTSKSLNEGALRFPIWSRGSVYLRVYTDSGLFDPDLPLRDYPADKWDLLLYGRDRTVEIGRYNLTYWGVVENFERLYLRRDISGMSERVRSAVARFVAEEPCGECGGARLNKAALATRVAGLGIAEMCAMEVGDLIGVLREVGDPVGGVIAARAVESLERVAAIGLDYLSLDRATSTLSGGEGQRLKMVKHLGSSLTGMTYVFDEPSIGLHPRDVHLLNELLAALRDKGNTVLVVEHDRDVIAVADHVVDMGPAAGAQGGRVMFEGTPEALGRSGTATGAALRRPPRLKDAVRGPAGWLTAPPSRLHNLRGVTARVATGVLTAVTGVAGSGKSTLMAEFAAAHPEAIVVDQSPIPASARSTPASFLGAMDGIRKMFAREHDVAPGLFSFNSTGACETCGGRGEIYTDLAYMDPVRTPCDTCGGRRFKAGVLAMRVRGKSIADVLDLGGAAAAEFFAGTPMAAPFAAMAEAGLPYLGLGRSLSTLSGGERQRLKLATRLGGENGLYILDEPTTGLHMADVDALIALLDRMVDAGNTVVVVEHDLDVVCRADRVLDLGPGGGRRGGRVVYEGVPRGLLDVPESVTGRCLAAALG